VLFVVDGGKAIDKAIRAVFRPKAKANGVDGIKSSARLDGKFLLRTCDQICPSPTSRPATRRSTQVERGWRDFQHILVLHLVYIARSNASKSTRSCAD
jgi:hypothetical protein